MDAIFRKVGYLLEAAGGRSMEVPFHYKAVNMDAHNVSFASHINSQLQTRIYREHEKQVWEMWDLGTKTKHLIKIM